MSWAKVYFLNDDDQTRGFYELVRRTHVVGYKENGQQIYQISVPSLTILRELRIPFEIAGYVEAVRPDHRLGESSMSWAKIYFPTEDDEVRGFYELFRRTHIVSYREAGRHIFQVSVPSMSILRELGIPFEIAGCVDDPRPDHLVEHQSD